MILLDRTNIEKAIYELRKDIENNQYPESDYYRKEFDENKIHIDELYNEFNNNSFYMMTSEYFSESFQEYAANGRLRTFTFMSIKKMILYYSFVVYVDYITKSFVDDYNSGLLSKGLKIPKRKESDIDFDNSMKDVFLQKNPNFLLKLDIKDFFAKIDHQTLVKNILNYSYKNLSVVASEKNQKALMLDLLSFINNGINKGIPLLRFSNFPSYLIPNIYLLNMPDFVFDFFSNKEEMLVVNIFRVCDDIEIYFDSYIKMNDFIYLLHVFVTNLQIKYLSTLHIELNDKKTEIVNNPSVDNSSLINNLMSYYSIDENEAKNHLKELFMENTEDDDFSYLIEKYEYFKITGKIEKLKSCINDKAVKKFLHKGFSDHRELDFFIYYVAFLNSEKIYKFLIGSLQNRPLVVDKIFSYLDKTHEEFCIFSRLFLTIMNGNKDIWKAKEQKLESYFNKIDSVSSKLSFCYLKKDYKMMSKNKENIMNSIAAYTYSPNNDNLKNHIKMLHQSIIMEDWTLSTNHLLNFIQAYILIFNKDMRNIEKYSELSDNPKIINSIFKLNIINSYERNKLNDLGKIRNSNIKSHSNLDSNEKMWFVSKEDFYDMLKIVDVVVDKIITYYMFH